VPRSDAPTRPSSARAWGLVALIWAVAVAFVLEVASDTRMGPVVYEFTRTHGVHLGDVYATLGCGAVALLLSVWVITDHGNKKRRYQRYLKRRAAEPVEVDPDEQETVVVSYAAFADPEVYSEPEPEPEFDYYDRGETFGRRHRRTGPEATEEIPRRRSRHALGD
jgi:hypothetical protein